MTGDLAEHSPAPQPLIARYYEALGFSTPGTEYDPETGTYQPDPPWPSLDYAACRLAEREEADPDDHECGADPQDSAGRLSELDGAALDWEAS